jgi:UDP-N-acetylmuramate--alanine ligase
MPTVVIAAGGTAGHVVPALAVADELQASGAKVVWVGTRDRAEAELVPAAGYEISFLSVQGLDRRNPLRAMAATARAGVAVGAAHRLLGRLGADVVLAGGGYVAGPVGLAAAARRIPLVLTEADSHLGLANRMLAPLARRVCLAFPIEGHEGERYLVTGRPVPRAVVEADRERARESLAVPDGAACVLVFGGSLGARSLNYAAVEALRDVGAHVLHITGRRDYAELRERLGETAGYRLIEYYADSLADPLAASDLVVARAGGSIFEIAASGRPAILVPYPHATADHQSKNARWMTDAGAATVIADGDLTAERLRAEVEALLGDRERLGRMGDAARAVARPDAAARIAQEVLGALGPGERAAEDLPWAGRDLHFVGIGGAGMSGLALVASALGARVTGCDRAETPYFAELRATGIEPQVGHDASHAAGGVELVVSTAIPSDLPEVVAARERGGPVHHRGELLAAAVSMRRVIAVAGTHGKTTTTAMTAHALVGCGVAAGYAVGAELTLPGGGHRPNAVWASDGWMVVEADESDRSFLGLDPEVAVLTNVELDHHTAYASEVEVREAFERFLARVPANGTVVRWEDAQVRVPDGPATVEFGLSARAALCARDVQAAGAGMRFTLVVDGIETDDVSLPVPGNHNVLNALAAIGAARAAGCDPAQAARALADFQPAGRRFEPKGEAAGVRVYDDYAHHATEVAATLAAARALEPRRLVAVFQPHLYSRTQHTHRDLGRALAAADLAVVLDVYPARERTEDFPGVSGRLVAAATADFAGGREVWWLPTREEATEVLAGLVEAGDLVVTLGAGDVDLVAEALVERLGGNSS